MEKKTYAYVGKWEHDRGKEKLGFDIFDYDAETGAMTQIGSSDVTDIMVGFTCMDSARGILYCTDEREDLPGMMGGGGRIFAFSLDKETGAMEQMSSSPSYGVRPGSLIPDKTGQYMIVTNHAGRKPITKTVKDCFGKLQIVTECDEANTVLFRMNPDGSFGEPADVFRHKITGALPSQNNPHPHQVAGAPDGSLYTVCDKGGDVIYRFQIDAEKGKLIEAGAPYRDEPGSSPRYGAFHKEKPFFFMNHETKPIIHSFRYDADGNLTLLDTQDILPEGYQIPEGVPSRQVAESSDLRINPNGKILYDVVRGLDIVTVYRIDTETGKLDKCQTVNLRGENEKAGARGCEISPDGRFLHVALLGCHRVVAVPIDEEGLLGTPKTVIDGIYSPANVTFWEPQQ